VAGEPEGAVAGAIVSVVAGADDVAGEGRAEGIAEALPDAARPGSVVVTACAAGAVDPALCAGCGSA
jgi:hypothetical protein